MNDFENARSGSRESNGITLGSYSYIHDVFRHEFGGRVTIGNYTGIANGCVLLSGLANHASAGSAYVSNYPWEHAAPADITIGNDVWVGANVILLPGVTIGDGAIIGAGCVVARDVSPFAVVVGNPQHVARYRFPPNLIAALLRIRWWDWPHPVVDVARRLPEFQDAAQFIKIADRLAPLAKACGDYVEE